MLYIYIYHIITLYNPFMIIFLALHGQPDVSLFVSDRCPTGAENEGTNLWSKAPAMGMNPYPAMKGIMVNNINIYTYIYIYIAIIMVILHNYPN